MELSFPHETFISISIGKWHAAEPIREIILELTLNNASHYREEVSFSFQRTGVDFTWATACKNRFESQVLP